jgi:hypothetical protein
MGKMKIFFCVSYVNVELLNCLIYYFFYFYTGITFLVLNTGGSFRHHSGLQTPAGLSDTAGFIPNLNFSVYEVPEGV